MQKPLTASQILSQLSKKSVHVVETYTSHAVYYSNNGKFVGYIWLTNPNQGALETWDVFTNPDEVSYQSYLYQQSNSNFTTMNFSASKAVDTYYQDPSWEPILGPGITVYVYYSINGTYLKFDSLASQYLLIDCG